MKNITLLLCFSLIFISCSSESEVDINKSRLEVLSVIDNYLEAHQTKNLDLFLNCFSSKPDIIILGTDQNELWVDRESVAQAQQRAYETFDEIRLSIRDKIIKVCDTGEQAWFYMRVNWYVSSEGKKFTFDHIRTTGVLQRENGNWGIVMMHTSLPLEGQAVRY